MSPTEVSPNDRHPLRTRLRELEPMLSERAVMAVEKANVYVELSKLILLENRVRDFSSDAVVALARIILQIENNSAANKHIYI